MESSMSVLDKKHFHDETAAYAWVEARVWPNGRICPHCGVADDSGALNGRSTRIGVYKCYSCRKPFTVKVGTIFEASHIKLHVWLQAMFLLCGSKKGISANQLHRTLGITLKSAWFMAHRIRLAMKDDGSSGPLGGAGKIVEVDETYIGPQQYVMKDGKRVGKQGPGGKVRIMTLVERKGAARSIVLPNFTTATVREILNRNVSKESRLMTDEANPYFGPGYDFADHQTVKHGASEYVRGDVTTNTVEGYFSVFKRGMRGTYQHCGEQHLPKYLAEFDFRYSNRSALGVEDVERTERAVRGIIGKRLTYR
jgi:transposase-like protein